MKYHLRRLSSPSNHDPHNQNQNPNNSNLPTNMVSFKPLLACLAVAASQPIDPRAITLEARGYGWLENSLGTEAYRCEYWTNPFFDKIHLAGRNSTHSEHEIKGAAKEAGAVTGWHWKDLGEGSFDVKVSFDLSFSAFASCGGSKWADFKTCGANFGVFSVQLACSGA